MKLFMRPTAAALLLLICLTGSIVGQQKRQTPARPQPKVAPTPAPTFETLIPANTYNFYCEIRGVGQLVRSTAVTDLLDPILKLSGPPKEFTSMVKWLNAHADELITSRMLIASWPAAKEVPEIMVAIEFASVEEAAKFAKPLNEHLTKVLPPTVQQELPPENDKTSAGEKIKAPTAAPTPAATPTPSFYLQQTGLLVLVTTDPLNFKKFKPAGSKLLADEINFRAARNRFNSEPVFVFFDVKAVEREEEEQRKKYEAMRTEEQKKMEAALLEQPKEEAPSIEELAVREKEMREAEEFRKEQVVAVGKVQTEETQQPQGPDPISAAMSIFYSSFGALPSKWPEAIALALGLENDSFDVRALFLNQPGERSDAVPFMPLVITGQSFVPESPNVLPADTELLITISLDLQQIYAAMSKPPSNNVLVARRTNSNGSNELTLSNGPNELTQDSPFAALEKRLQLNVRDDVLPLLGSEVAIRLPVRDFNILGLVGLGRPQSNETPSPNAAPVLLISLRDKEGVRALMPKLVEGMGFKGASALAQTEKREDTEIVSYAGFFSYAFIGNFIVLSAEPATTRYVVDSYLKKETLSSDTQFRNSTRWQPRPAQGQLYVSPALMEGYRSWIQQPSTRMGEETRTLLTRLAEVAQPITYSLSNEGLGPLHELHLPKNLVLMVVAAISGDSNPPPELVNERKVAEKVHHIAYAQERFKNEKGHGSYGTLEQLIEEELLTKEALELSGYKLYMTVTGDKFELTATPTEYGNSGKVSYFIDQTFTLRGGDKNGASATSSDPPIQ